MHIHPGRLLDDKVSEKTHRALVTYLNKCTIFLVEELACFGGSLTSLFCRTTLAEYAKSSLRDQIYKVIYHQSFVISLWNLH